MKKLLFVLFLLFSLPLHAQFIRQYTSSSDPSGGCANNTAWVANTNHTFSWCDNGVWRTTVPISGSYFTPRSVLFADSSGQISQDNANFFWDDTADTLFLNTTAKANAQTLAVQTYCSSGNCTGIQAAVNSSGSSNISNLFGNNVAEEHDSTGTLDYVYGYYASTVVKGFGAGTITNVFAFDAADQTVGTNNIGYRSEISSGTNKYNFYANGTAQNYFAGNVGIGTTSPSSALDIEGGSVTVAHNSINSNLIISNTNDIAYVVGIEGNTKGIRFGTNSTGSSIEGVDNTLVGSYQPLNINASYLTFGNNNTEAMRITGGNVGIGATTPGVPLDVVGAIRGSTTISSGSIAFASLGTPANGTRTYCSDCDTPVAIGNVCSSSGDKAGAYAIRVRATWECE